MKCLGLGTPSSMVFGRSCFSMPRAQHVFYVALPWLLLVVTKAWDEVDFKYECGLTAEGNGVMVMVMASVMAICYGYEDET